MNTTKQHLSAVRDLLNAERSLRKAIEDAGGSANAILDRPYALDEMSMLEFLAQIAGPNHIRFYHQKPDPTETD